MSVFSKLFGAFSSSVEPNGEIEAELRAQNSVRKVSTKEALNSSSEEEFKAHAELVRASGVRIASLQAVLGASLNAKGLVSFLTRNGIYVAKNDIIKILSLDGGEGKPNASLRTISTPLEWLLSNPGKVLDKGRFEALALEGIQKRGDRAKSYTLENSRATSMALSGKIGGIEGTPKEGYRIKDVPILEAWLYLIKRAKFE